MMITATATTIAASATTTAATTTASGESLSVADVRDLRDRLERQRRLALDEYEHDLARERAIPLDEAGDVVDRAEVAADREELFAAAQTAFELIQEIDEALLRISDGSYGLCMEGGEPIPLDRLRALPWARCCAAHQEQIEEGQRRRHAARRERVPFTTAKLATR
jgi:DnaK suppressor protein